MGRVLGTSNRNTQKIVKTHVKESVFKLRGDDNCVGRLHISPSHFLLEIKEIGILDLDNVEKTILGKRYKYRQNIKETLRQRFRSEYSGTLTYQKRSFGYARKINVGELVLIGNDNLKRIDWPLARVKELYVGKDGNVRVARLITTKGELTRPIQRLFPLELESKFSNEDFNNVHKRQDTEEKGDKKIRECKSSKQIVNGKDEKQNIVTKRGREVKIPNRLIYY